MLGNELHLIWKDPTSRRNYTVGRFMRGEEYTFEYCGEYKEAKEGEQQYIIHLQKQPRAYRRHGKRHNDNGSGPEFRTADNGKKNQNKQGKIRNALHSSFLFPHTGHLLTVYADGLL